MEDTTKSSTSSADSSITFTPNETKLICAIMQNLTSEIQFDVDRVALDLGYKNAGSLRARWNSLKRSKISGAATDAAAPAGGVSKATPSKKAKATPKKAKAAADGEDEEASPTKKAGKGGKADPKIKTEEGDDEVIDSVEGPQGVAL